MRIEFMLTPAILFFLISASSSNDSVATRLIPSPCRLVSESAVRYLEEHDFYTSTKADGENIFVDLGNHEKIKMPSAKPLSLNRFSVRKYTQPKHLPPMRTYYDFRLEGHLVLTKATEGSCNATLRFEISAYGYVWLLGVIDDGYRSYFISNGTLERLYLDSVAALLSAQKQPVNQAAAGPAK